MSDIIDEYREWLADRQDLLRTHYDRCYVDRVACMVVRMAAEIGRLRAQVERLRAAAALTDAEREALRRVADMCGFLSTAKSNELAGRDAVTLRGLLARAATLRGLLARLGGE